MAVFKCKMCGGNLEVQDGMTVCECEYCGSKQTVPQLDNEKKINLFTRANRLRSACEFDKASGVYESIVTEFPEEAEAYWGLVLCKYGIEYVDDPKTGRKVPTCHRSSFDSVMDDPNFDMVMECSDPTSRAVYRGEAKTIEALREAIIEVSSKEDPYDIFICYKENDATGNRTIDSVIAQDVYDALTEKGYKVFFSRITLEDKLGQEYEPYIFAALNSAKVMLAFGTDYENFNAVWVKNEWSRFLSLIEKGAKKTLIPCFKGIDAYDMPKEFAKLSAQDMGKVGAIQDLLRGINKIIGGKPQPVSHNYVSASNPEASALIQRGNMALEDSDFKDAENFFERALDINPSDAQAYLGKFLAAYHFNSLDDMDNKACPLDDIKEFRRAVQFADPALSQKLKAVKNTNDRNIELFKLKDVIRQIAVKEGVHKSIRLAAKCTQEDYARAVAIFDSLEKNNCISVKKSYNYKKDLDSQFFALSYLRKCLEPRSLADISSYAREHGILFSSLVLEQLVNEKLIEAISPGTSGINNAVNLYCWPGAVEEKERLLREEEERKQKKRRQQAAFDAACAEVNANAKKEVDSKTASIEEQFAPRFHSVQREIDDAVAASDRQRNAIQGKIDDLRRQQSSLGFFKGKEKRALQEQIDEQQGLLKKIPTASDIQKQFQPQIDQINSEKQVEIETVTAEVYSRYILPRLEDFSDV